MKIRTAYLKTNSRYSYRDGEVAKITGIFLITPEKHDSRPCFQLEFSDGDIDYMPINDDAANYEIIEKPKDF